MFLWCLVGGADIFDAGGSGQSPEGWSELGVMVANQLLGVLAEGRGLAQLLADPGVGWGAGDADRHDAASSQLDHEAGMVWAPVCKCNGVPT
jgi:hypothetical protein